MVYAVPLVAYPQFLKAKVAPPPAVKNKPGSESRIQSPVSKDGDFSFHPSENDVVQCSHVSHVVGTDLQKDLIAKSIKAFQLCLAMKNRSRQSQGLL